ncbi:MAG: ATP-binding protein [Lachnospiraceae bacterium]|nr:ATP-binding protein [Lachnospiraceae bacterium]
MFIIEQLLSNAVKYTEEGTITISGDDNLVLSIADTGIGIAPEDLPRIFQRGFTGYNGHAHKKSTGLGLYLCKKAAKRLESPIWVSSKTGIGTTVFLNLQKESLIME